MPFSVLPLSRKAEFSVPPLIVTRASAPTLSVLTTSVPAPLVVTLFSVWLPLRNSSLAPLAMLNTPLSVPPPCISSVPAFTLTVPVLLNCVPTAVVVFDCLLKTPLLLKMPPPPPALMVLSNALASVKLPVLLKALALAMLMPLLLAAVLPDQVVLPALILRPPDNTLLPGPLIASVPPKVVLAVAAPVIVPPVQVAGPPNV